MDVSCDSMAMLLLQSIKCSERKLLYVPYGMCVVSLRIKPPNSILKSKLFHHWGHESEKNNTIFLVLLRGGGNQKNICNTKFSLWYMPGKLACNVIKFCQFIQYWGYITYEEDLVKPIHFTLEIWYSSPLDLKEIFVKV